ncbi:MAG: ankyrin repeat domain-containing protein [Planctomycetota bacterium]|jgi:hypothetical protein
MRSGIRYAVVVVLLALAAEAGEFTAVLKQTKGGQTRTGRIRVKGGLYRLEIEEAGEALLVIVDPGENRTRVLAPARRAYLEMASDDMRSRANDPFGLARSAAERFEKRAAGTATIGGHACEKLEYLHDGQPVVTVWHCAKLGFPLRIERHAGPDASVELSEIKEEAQDDALFRVPAGFEPLKPDRPEKKPPPEGPQGRTGTVYTTAPCGSQLAAGGEIRVRLELRREASIELSHRVAGEGRCVLQYFRLDRPLGEPRTYTEKGRSRRSVEKSDRVQADEVRVRVEQGLFAVHVDQILPRHAKDLHTQRYVRGPASRTEVLKPGRPFRLTVVGDTRSRGQILLSGKGEMKQVLFQLANGEAKCWTIPPEQEVQRVEVQVREGAVRAEWLQSDLAAPVARLTKEAGAALTPEQAKLFQAALHRGDLEWLEHAVEHGLAMNDVVKDVPVFATVVGRGSPPMVALALKRGGDLSWKDAKGDGVLRTAFRNRRHWRAVVPLLVEAGADVKAKNEWGFTPLWYAVNLITANNGGLEVAILLLDKGAEVDPPLRAGDTPLLAAATAGHLELVKVLLEHGADPTKAGRKGRTPLSAARECGHTEIAKLLESRKPAR